MFPSARPRRLRRTPLLRELVRETGLEPAHLVYPLFVREGATPPEPIVAMPGQSRHGLESLLAEVEASAKDGVGAVLLFGIPSKKDETGSSAVSESGIVQRAVRAIKREGLPLLLMTDVCLCEYTSHGHCGVLRGEEVDNDATLPLLSRVALSHAEAGADIVAPSDMMDGRVAAIRSALDQGGHSEVAILSYAAKYASAFYGPFREAAGSAPAFGDRSGYQMDPANLREALKEVEADIAEGADIVMVKPALAYLDVIRAVKEATRVPVAAYNVSGEYAMIELAARAGLVDRGRIISEVLLSIKRAGADLIFTYHAREAARALRQGNWG